MKRYSITIIGMGPRGLSVFERIAAFAREHATLIQLNLVDPSFCGPGVHAVRQPQHLSLNSLASQITMFPSPGSVELAPACMTPSLTEWARAQGYRRFGAEYCRVGEGAEGAQASGGVEIGEDDHLPRQLLGRYLSWAYGAVQASMPPTVTVNHLRHRAIDMSRQSDGALVVELDSGFAITSDFVFLTTGHGNNHLTDEQAWLRKFAQDHARYNSRLHYVRQVYPLDKLSGIGHDAQVGIEGLGLTAYDVLAELTVGRGGRYEAAGQALRYLPSSQEPALTLFSRTCLPASAQAARGPGPAARRQAWFLTRDAIRDLRAQALRQRGSAQLDFDREVLPLLFKEMGFAYRCAEDLLVPERQAPDPLWYKLGENEQRAIDTLLFPLRGRSFADPAEFAAFVRAHLEADLREAARGAVVSPVKAAAEALRDARGVLQECIEHAGLLPASHRKFLSVYHPAIKRVAFGPPALRNAQLLALMDAGVVRVAHGPHPLVRIDEERSQFALHSRFPSQTQVQHLDTLITARLDVFSPETDDTIFMRNLLKRGAIRPYYNGTFHPGGLDIDAHNHPVNRAGQPIGNIWALGCLTEGPQYDTHALPRPQQQSRQVQDAERCVAALFTAIAALPVKAPVSRPRVAPSERASAAHVS